MNIEAFNYSVLASILGIMIVFLSLCGLSLLMVLLKVVFKERVKDKTASATSSTAAAAPAGPAVTAVKREDNNWIMAAVSAFLALEDENSPSAAGWGPAGSEKSDPWINRSAFDKKLG